MLRLMNAEREWPKGEKQIVLFENETKTQRVTWGSPIRRDLIFPSGFAADKIERPEGWASDNIILIFVGLLVHYTSNSGPGFTMRMGNVMNIANSARFPDTVGPTPSSPHVRWSEIGHVVE
jgi:hypothetical protein